MTTKPRDNRLILVGLLLVCGWLIYDRGQLKQQIAAGSHSTAAADRLAEVAAPITAALTQPKAGQLAGFYAALEDVIERDSDVVTSTGLFRTAHGRALTLAFQATPTAGEPAVGELIDAVFFEALGDQNRPIDDAVRLQLLAAVRAVATACEAVR